MCGPYKSEDDTVPLAGFVPHFRIEQRFQFVRVGTKFGQYLGFREPEYLTFTVHLGALAAECLHCAIILYRVHRIALQLPLIPSN